MSLWIASFGRLTGAIGLFYTVYSASPKFKALFDQNIGPTLLHQTLLIAISYFATELLLSLLYGQERIEAAIASYKDKMQKFHSTPNEVDRTEDGASIQQREIGALDFEETLIAYITSLRAKQRNRHILRLHAALSRYLWVEGLLRARVALGDATDDAAAELGDKEAQLRALIDDLGWTLVALKDYQKASDKIQYGRHIACTENKPYWVAKALRHIAGIHTVRREYKLAADYLDQAAATSEQIENQTDQQEMLAGIEYARAVVDWMRGEYTLAMEHVEKSDKLRIASGDETRTVRSYALRGKILLARKDPISIGAAKAQFRQGLRAATNLGRRDEIIRNENGLAKVAEMECELQAAEQHRAQAKALLKDTPVPYEIEDQNLQ